MQGECYRIVATTFAVRSIDGRPSYVHVPIGTLVNLIDAPLYGNRLVDVLWRNTEFLMFTQDLRQRAEVVVPQQLELPFTHDAPSNANPSA